MISVLVTAHCARSVQLYSAARLLAIGWAFTLQVWLVADGALEHLGYAALDFGLAAAFFIASRERIFPRPLFVLHAALALFHLGAFLFDPNIYWSKVFLNRTFELELAYVLACAIYKIRSNRSRRA